METYSDLQEQKNAALKVLNQIQQQLSKTQGIEGAIDIHHPERSPNWPVYRHRSYPKMLYHPTKLDPGTEARRLGIRQRNDRNPTLAPLDLPASEPLSVIVKNEDEDKARRAEGFIAKPPFLQSNEEVIQFDPLANPVADVALCSRGCGKAPHRGACSGKVE